MKSSHRFPLRRQIVWGMRFFTILTSLAVGAALFTLSNQYVRANSLQAAEFNLRLVATSIETSLDSADALLNWASIDSTVRRVHHAGKYQRHPDHCRLRSHAGKILFQHPVQPYPPLFCYQ